MHEIPASLAEFATRELRGRGIEIRTGTRLERMSTSARATLSDRRARSRPARSAGPRACSRRRSCGELGLPLDAGRPDRDRRAPARARAGTRLGHRRRRRGAGPGPATQRAVPADRPARASARAGVVADNVAAALGGGRPRQFRYRTLGVFVDMGQHKAVATMLGLRLRGFPAWFAARTYHLPDAGHGAPAAADARLDRRPALRPRLGRARRSSGHPPTLGGLPRRPGRRRDRRRVDRAADELTFREGRRRRPAGRPSRSRERRRCTTSRATSG